MDDVLTGFALRVSRQSKRYTLRKRINRKLYRDKVEETHVYDGPHHNLYNARDKTNNVPTLKRAYNYFKSTKTSLAKSTITTYD